MDIKEMNMAQIEERKAAIVAEIENEGADLDALEAEMRALNAEIEARTKAEAQRAEIRKAVADNKVGEVKEVIQSEERKMDKTIEVRNTQEYINAYAEYIKTGKDAECRALLTENVSGGTIPVPTFVYDIVKTAWDKEGIIAKVKKAYLAGNLKVGFEISSTGAVIHTEGSDAVTEETLTLGVVTIVPASIKKWISVSDEVLDMRGEAFLRYIYDELVYQIAKKAADTLVASIIALGTSATSTSVAVPQVTATTVTMGLTASAIAKLSDEAANPTIMMNKQTWAEFKAVQYANGYGADPFEGLDVEFNNTIPAFADASTGDTYMIVGDLGHGALMNLPNGDGVEFKFDDKTDMAKDLVRILGRMYAGIGIVANNAFVKVVK